MKIIIFLILTLFSFSLLGGNKVLDNLKASREKTIQREKFKRKAALKKIKEEYLKKLEELMKKLTQKGDLDAALEVKAEIEAVKNQ